MSAPLRVAVVGSGPAGFYAAAPLLAAGAEVDLIERLPTPWGLVRLGVAPDHPQLKTVSRAFEKIAAQPGFRFLGNVEVGRDLTHDELARSLRRGHLLVRLGRRQATRDSRRGAPRVVGRPRSSSPGTTATPTTSSSTSTFALPSAWSWSATATSRSTSHGCSRSRTTSSRRPTPPTSRSRPSPARGIREIVVLGRRGPVQASWTSTELHEMGDLAGADIVVDPAELELDPASAAELAEASNIVKRNMEILREFASA